MSAVDNIEPPRGSSFGKVFLLICAVTFPLVLGLSMTKGLIHDEHQHVAAGALIAREGQLPYRDFLHFHTPYLPLIYSLVFRLTDHLFFAARLLSVISATAIVGVVGAVGYRLFRDRGTRMAVGVSACSTVLCLMTPLFSQATGRAWNHEPALILVLLAFVAHVTGFTRQRNLWFIASGTLLGVAIGIRITYAPLVAPFGLALLFFFPPPRWRLSSVVSFMTGLCIGCSVLFWLSAQAPEKAWFSNFEFAKVNIFYRFNTGETRTMTVAKKLQYFAKLAAGPNCTLFLVGILPCAAALMAHRGTLRRLRFEFPFILLLLPFLLLGSFAPTPLFQQYLYPFVPFMVLAGMYALASIPSDSNWFRRMQIVGALCTALSVALGHYGYRQFKEFFSVKEWAPTKLHQRAAEISSHVSHGPVLTFAPIYPLETGLSIYPAFSTGPFAWRVSPYVGSDKAKRIGMMTPTTLSSILDRNPPTAILLDFGKSREEELLSYAKDHGYSAVQLSDKNELWIAPVR